MSEIISKLAVELALESGSFAKQMSSINKEIKNLDRDFKNASKGVEGFEKTFTGLDAKITKTSKQLELYSQKLESQKSAYSNLQSTIEKQVSKLNELESTLGKSSDEWQKQSQLVQKNSEKFNKLGSDINTTESNISKLTNELNQAQQELQQLGQKTETLDDKLDKISQSAKLAESEFNKLSSELAQSGGYFAKLGNEMDHLSSQIDSGKAKINAYESEISKIGSVLDKAKAEHQQLGQAINKTEQELNQAKSAYGENSSEALQLKAKLLQLKDSYNQLESEIEQNESALNGYQAELNNTVADVNRLSQELQTMPFDRVGNDMRSMGQSIKGVGQDLIPVTLAIGGIGTAATKTGIDFDSAMSKVKALSGATEEQFEALEAEAKRLGSTTSLSATQAAEGLQFFALAGYSVEESISALAPTIKLAEVSGLDLGQASDLVTDSLSSLGLEVKDLVPYMDILANASANSNSSVDQLAEAFIVCGGTLDGLNVPLEESTAWLGILADQGLKGSQAGNALQSTLINLTTGAGQAGVAMKELGISAFDSNGNFIGIEATLLQLNDALAGCTEEQKNTYLAMIGGKTNVDTLNKLLNGLGGSFTNLNGKLKDSEGSLDRMSKIMKDNLGGAIDNMKSAIEGALLSAFDTLEPIITKVVNKITELANKFTELSPTTQKVVIAIAGIVAIIPPL